MWSKYKCKGKLVYNHGKEKQNVFICLKLLKSLPNKPYSLIGFHILSKAWSCNTKPAQICNSPQFNSCHVKSLCISFNILIIGKDSAEKTGHKLEIVSCPKDPFVLFHLFFNSIINLPSMNLFTVLANNL